MRRRIRYWLIRRLAGRESVILNAHFDSGHISATHYSLIRSNMFSGTSIDFTEEAEQ